MTETLDLIYGFHQGGYDWLSNFWVESSGITNEHRFQAAKATNWKDYDYVMSAPTAAKAKRRGREIKNRYDWEDIKYSVMCSTLRYKFEDPELRAKLLATGSTVLVEANWWHDTTWGVDIKTGIGRNLLGKALMQIRDELLKVERKASSYT